MLRVRSAPPPKHLVRLAGEYDLTRKDELATVFSQLDGHDEVVIDMRDVTYIDSTVLRELAALQLRNPQRPVSLRGVNEPILHVLRIVGFDRLLDIA